jgi:hypothetical protein
MKIFLLAVGILFTLVSCKVSENITVDQISKNSDLSEMKTFQVITQKNASREITHLNRIFEDKLIENGFSPAEENPDFLIQTVIASVHFEKEVMGFSNSVGLTGNSPYSPISTEPGEYGKVIFLIQNAKTNEVIWMGTGTGILSENQLLKKKDIQSALDQLIAGLK